MAAPRRAWEQRLVHARYRDGVKGSINTHKGHVVLWPLKFFSLLLLRRVPCPSFCDPEHQTIPWLCSGSCFLKEELSEVFKDPTRYGVMFGQEGLYRAPALCGAHPEGDKWGKEVGSWLGAQKSKNYIP